MAEQEEQLVLNYLEIILFCYHYIENIHYSLYENRLMIDLTDSMENSNPCTTIAPDEDLGSSTNEEYNSCRKTLILVVYRDFTTSCYAK